MKFNNTDHFGVTGGQYVSAAGFKIREVVNHFIHDPVVGYFINPDDGLTLLKKKLANEEFDQEITYFDEPLTKIKLETLIRRYLEAMPWHTTDGVYENYTKSCVLVGAFSNAAYIGTIYPYWLKIEKDIQ